MNAVKFWTTDNRMVTGTDENLKNTSAGIVRVTEYDDETLEEFWPWSAIRVVEVRTPKNA